MDGWGQGFRCGGLKNVSKIVTSTGLHFYGRTYTNGLKVLKTSFKHFRMGNVISKKYGANGNLV